MASYAADAFGCTSTDWGYPTVRPKAKEMKQDLDLDVKCHVKSCDQSTVDSKRRAICQKLKAMINEATKAARVGKCVQITSEFIGHGVGPLLFDQLAECFPSIKMEYDNGKIKIIDIQGRGHQAVISIVSGQFRDFYRPLGKSFRPGGGLTPTYVKENDLYRKTDKKADPDEALNVLLNDEWMFCLIFEVEIHNRNFAKLDERMKFLLGGWADCCIGIAVKYFPRLVDHGAFEGVLLIYYKRDGMVALEELRDVGTAQLTDSHQALLTAISENVQLAIPTPEERCKIVRNQDEDTLESSNPDFYRVDVDSVLLYQNTKFAELANERPTLTLDFLEITEQLHCVEGKTFSGS